MFVGEITPDTRQKTIVDETSFFATATKHTLYTYIYMSYIIICQLCVPALLGKVDIAVLGGAKWG